MARTTIAIASMLVAGGCTEPATGRGFVPPPPQEQPRQVTEGDYGPIARYLVDSAIPPAPENDDGVGTESDDGGTPPPPADPICDGFTCNDGWCIDAAWQCDDVPDCTEAEDELGCPSSETTDGDTCSGFSCDDGMCIDATWQCDEYDDCAGGEDELDCGWSDLGGDPECENECWDGECIPTQWLCDGEPDCSSGEDEVECAAHDDAPGLVSRPRVQEGEAIDCIMTSTALTGLGGIAVAEAATKGCEVGGVVVGFMTAGGGFAAAGVCFAADVTQIDALLGGLSGAVAGLVGGVAMCEGDALAEAGEMLEALWSTGSASIPLFEVQPATGTTAKRCGIALEVPLSGDEAECEELHADMKEFEFTRSHKCNVDIGNLGTDPTAIAAACAEIQRNFDNAAKLADKRLEVGRRCYENGNVGPMGNSDFGHQFAWCGVHEAMQNCVEQANHAKLRCPLTQTMAQHYLPGGCGNVLACQ